MRYYEHRPSYVNRDKQPKRAYGFRVGDRVRLAKEHVETEAEQKMVGKLIDIDDGGSGIAIGVVVWNTGFEDQINVRKLVKAYGGGH